MKNKNTSRFLIAIVAIIFAASSTSCKKNDAVILPTTPIDSTIGLPQAVINQVPDSIIQKLKDLGMPINEGIAPPNIEGIYLGSPWKLVASNFDDFAVGHLFTDLKVKFNNQNNATREINTQTKAGTTISDETVSFISGHDSVFSVFIITNFNTISGTDTTDIQQFVRVFSGVKTSNDASVRKLRSALMSLKEIKKTTNSFLKVGQGRLIFDSDELSETQATFRLSQPENWTPNHVISKEFLK
jgi:hypothetical protein